MRGLTATTVPDRAHEHDATGGYADGDASANCVNPIFAQELPTDPGADLCHLTRGPRTPDLVHLSVIGGVPHQLLQFQPGVDPECPAGTAQAECPQKTQLTEADWLAITGKDPDHYDFRGVDPHMRESSAPRAGVPLPSAPDNADPMNGREWTTHGAALELACTFPLAAPKQDCTPSELGSGCDCGSGGDMPVCDAKSGAQVRGKAYPSIREAQVAHAMANSASGVQGTVSSICPIHVVESAAGDPLYAFRCILTDTVSRLGREVGLAACVSPPLPRNASGGVPCTVLATLPRPGNESLCAALGLEVPDAAVLRQFRRRRETEWHKERGPDAGLPNPQDLPTCVVPQLVGSKVGADGWCDASPKAGWCLGTNAPYCAQYLMLSSSASDELPGATITVSCSDGC